MAHKAKSKEKREKSEVLARADELLATIARYSIRLEEAEATYQADLQAVKNRHQDIIVGFQDSMTTYSEDLVDLMKGNSGAIFEGEERVELENGSLLFTIEERVKKVRGMLENLKARGFKEAIIISESVDWDLIEKWPAERLALVGTKKGRKEIYNFELKTTDDGRPTTDD